ncbi:hypothetical protein AXF42_Ash002641 [Apostasia shenzhenica]|uniref:Uncharacterized protein n=1 Tax=Apostasia shenzhenica TaxID=1088818 RepID=A0A2I0APD0_9ASPA|nr:hypothetical protein AXF42_Ash002641 [Apostasia shenzhenica]
MLEDAKASPPDVSRAKKEKKRKHWGDEPSATMICIGKNYIRDERRPHQTHEQKHFFSRPPNGVDPENYYEFHGNYGHKLHKCRTFRALLNKLADQSKVELMLMAPTSNVAQKGKALED